MSGALGAILAVLFLAEGEGVRDAAEAARFAREADAGYERAKPAPGAAKPGEGAAKRTDGPKGMRIRSVSTDYDRNAGVIFFEGAVHVTSTDGYEMCADRLFVFMNGTNELTRIVALGAVSLTNGVRTGSCAMATYRRLRNEIEMFGSSDGKLAALAEGGARKSEVRGKRIRFRVDSEQVEVVGSEITMGAGGLSLPKGPGAPATKGTGAPALKEKGKQGGVK